MIDDLQEKKDILHTIVEELEAYHQRFVLLFGSMARFRAGIDTYHVPNDMDLLVVGDQIPPGFETKDFGFPTEITRMRTHTMTEIARSLRYDSRPVALSKLYGNNCLRRRPAA